MRTNKVALLRLFPLHRLLAGRWQWSPMCYDPSSVAISDGQRETCFASNTSDRKTGFMIGIQDGRAMIKRAHFGTSGTSIYDKVLPLLQTLPVSFFGRQRPLAGGPLRGYSPLFHSTIGLSRIHGCCNYTQKNRLEPYISLVSVLSLDDAIPTMLIASSK